MRRRCFVIYVRVGAAHDPTPHEPRFIGVHTLRLGKDRIRAGLVSPPVGRTRQPKFRFCPMSSDGETMIVRLGHLTTSAKARLRRSAIPTMLLENTTHEMRIGGHCLGVNVIHPRITVDRQIEQRFGGVELVRMGVNGGALNVGAEKDEPRPALLYRDGLIQYFYRVRVLSAQ